MSGNYTKLRNMVLELVRMSSGDALSLTSWYTEAQQVMRFVRDERLEVSPFLHGWLSRAEARAKDPLLAATDHAELAKFLAELPKD